MITRMTVISFEFEVTVILFSSAGRIYCEIKADMKDLLLS